MTEKYLTVKLWVATDTNQYIVQIGGKCLFLVKEGVALALKEKEDIDVVQVKNVNEIK